MIVSNSEYSQLSVVAESCTELHRCNGVGYGTEVFFEHALVSSPRQLSSASETVRALRRPAPTSVASCLWSVTGTRLHPQSRRQPWHERLCRYVAISWRGSKLLSRRTAGLCLNVTTTVRFPSPARTQSELQPGVLGWSTGTSRFSDDRTARPGQVAWTAAATAAAAGLRGAAASRRITDI